MIYNRQKFRYQCDTFTLGRGIIRFCIKCDNGNVSDLSKLKALHRNNTCTSPRPFYHDVPNARRGRRRCRWDASPGGLGELQRRELRQLLEPTTSSPSAPEQPPRGPREPGALAGQAVPTAAAATAAAAASAAASAGTAAAAAAGGRGSGAGGRRRDERGRGRRRALVDGEARRRGPGRASRRARQDRWVECSEPVL